MTKYINDMVISSRRTCDNKDLTWGYHGTAAATYLAQAMIKHARPIGHDTKHSERLRVVDNEAKIPFTAAAHRVRDLNHS